MRQRNGETSQSLTDIFIVKASTANQMEIWPDLAKTWDCRVVCVNLWCDVGTKGKVSRIKMRWDIEGLKHDVEKQIIKSLNISKKCWAQTELSGMM